ncbi:MAG: BLUF domain-containing protein [Cytophagia bacterium]|nr:BLUF domain-containing protein [Cytophagia bacterium]NBW35744.1 BLUF domain-containing protein [Cytophagia bacterium]
MYYLVYSSVAVSITENDLHDILQTSHLRNAGLNLTGMLLYCNGKFLQVLEGEKEAVHNLFYKINRDLRHKDINVLLEGTIAARNFKDWSMGFKALDLDTAREISGFEDIDQFFMRTKVSDRSHPALIFLSLFYQKNHSDHLQYL